MPWYKCLDLFDVKDLTRFMVSSFVCKCATKNIKNWKTYIKSYINSINGARFKNCTVTSKSLQKNKNKKKIKKCSGLQNQKLLVAIRIMICSLIYYENFVWLNLYRIGFLYKLFSGVFIVNFKQSHTFFQCFYTKC